MSQQIINISNPDDGLGDVLRNGFYKTNQNFTELYNEKVDKVTGKGLSTNDFTDTLKTKLDGIEAGAQVNVQADAGETDPLAPSFIKNFPPSLYASVGYFDYNDLATQTTPISLSSGIMTKLTNDAEGDLTSIDQAPYLVSSVWNTTDNQFDFSQMSVGDTIDLRVDCKATTTGTNKTLKFFLKLGIGTASEFYKLIGSSEYKTAITDEEVVKEISFYIGSEDIKEGRGELYVLLDSSGEIKVNGWYTRIIRKNLNIVEIIGGGVQSVTGSMVNNSDPLNPVILSDNTKLDKSTTPSSVYATDALGNPEMIAKISLKDVLEFANLAAFPGTGESGKIYVALDTNLQYRWSGSAYVQIGGNNPKDIVTNTSVTGTFNLDANLTDTYVLALTGNTTLALLNFSTTKAQQMTIYITGNFALTYPSGAKVFGTYSTTKTNQLVLEKVGSATYITINNYV